MAWQASFACSLVVSLSLFPLSLPLSLGYICVPRLFASRLFHSVCVSESSCKLERALLSFATACQAAALAAAIDCFYWHCALSLANKRAKDRIAESERACAEAVRQESVRRWRRQTCMTNALDRGCNRSEGESLGEDRGCRGERVNCKPASRLSGRAASAGAQIAISPMAVCTVNRPRHG